MSDRSCFRTGLAVVAFVLALAVLMGTSSHAEEELPQNLPPFSLKTLKGEDFDLAARKGTPLTAVVFFATWNPKSQGVLRDVELLRAKYADKGLGVIGVNTEAEATTAEFGAELEKYVADANIAYPVAMDLGLVNYRAWQVKAMPSTFLLGPELNTVAVLAGAPTGFNLLLEEEIQKALGIAKPEEEKAAPTHYKAERAVMLNFGMAQKLAERGGGSKALKKIEDVLKADPKFPDAHALQGKIILTEEQDKDLAAKEPARLAFEKALELDPNLPIALLGRAYFLLAQGKNDEAMAAMRDAMGKKAWGFNESPSAEDVAEVIARLDAAAKLFAEQKNAEAAEPLQEVLDAFLILHRGPQVTMPPAKQ